MVHILALLLSNNTLFIKSASYKTCIGQFIAYTGKIVASLSSVRPIN